MFSASINAPTYLNGTTGFIVNGVPSTGFSASNGRDINGDNITDLVLGAEGGNQAYVIFGHPSSAPFASPFDATTLNGSNGFNITGGSHTGWSVSNGGDINGDSIADLVVGADSANQVYVIYGQPSGVPFPANINAVTYLNGTTGFIVYGGVGDEIGSSVTNEGDINGDGNIDLVVGSYTTARTFVIYGKPSGMPFPASINLPSYVNGTTGFMITGGLTTGDSVSNSGDINGDGRTDLVIGAPGSDQAYVIYGKLSTDPFPATIAANTYLNGTTGFVINGGSWTGDAVGNGGDINGDGRTDLVITAFNIGHTYVIYGQPNGSPFPPVLNATTYLDGTTGFIADAGFGTGTGTSVSNAGDINNDGVADIIVGATGRSKAYVIYGKPSGMPFPASISVPSNLNGTTGFVITGSTGTGSAVSNAGDINGDGLTDFIVGANDASNQAYVIFGGPPLSSSPSTSPSLSPSPSPSPSASVTFSSLGSLSVSSSIGSSSIAISSSSHSMGLSSSVSVGLSSSSDVSTSAVVSSTKATSFQASLSAIGTSSTSDASISRVTMSIVPVPSSSIAETSEESLTTQESISSSITTALATRSVSKVKSSKIKKSKRSKKTTPAAITQVQVSTAISSTSTRVVPAATVDQKPLLGGGRRVRPANAPVQSGELIKLPVGATTKKKTTTARKVKTTGKPKNRVEELAINHHAEVRDNKLLQLRTAPDDSSNLRTEPMWMGMPMLNAVQIPLAQTGIHVIQQGYNCIMDWFQGKGSDEGIQIQELLTREQVGVFLQDYNKVSQELESILQQLESDNTITGNILAWLKDSIVEHRAQGQKLVQEHLVSQENIKAYFENIQSVAKDLTELVKDLAETTNSVAVSYVQSRLAGVNQELSALSENPAVIAKDQAMLKANVCAQMQANSLQQQLMNVLPAHSTVFSLTAANGLLLV